jgi:hypothetical protein
MNLLGRAGRTVKRIADYPYTDKLISPFPVRAANGRLGYDGPKDLASQLGLDPSHPALAKMTEAVDGLTAAAVKP